MGSVADSGARYILEYRAGFLRTTDQWEIGSVRIFVAMYCPTVFCAGQAAKAYALAGVFMPRAWWVIPPQRLEDYPRSDSPDTTLRLSTPAVIPRGTRAVVALWLSMSTTLSPLSGRVRFEPMNPAEIVMNILTFSRCQKDHVCKPLTRHRPAPARSGWRRSRRPRA